MAEGSNMGVKHSFDSEVFKSEFHCDQPMSAFCGTEGTRIFLWAPTAESVFLHLYLSGHDGNAVETIPMEKGKRGVWNYATTRNMDGWYYDFDVTVAGKTQRTADPYARACGVNGYRSMVVDLKRTNPAGWEEDKAPAATPEQVIYELHVRDFSWDPAGGFAAKDRGKYTALCRTGTTLNADGKHPTGLDYLKRLGVTHIQLMPVYDYGSVDEAHPENGYNWGYDPVNYNVPEGGFSSDPYHGAVRIRELKEMIQSLHKAGFRVIMDVVYNHTYRADSWLERTVPGYYYRHQQDGSLSNGSGCGNDIASERSMCAKYILDSCLYWVREYHMDGFRFDLMGLLDRELLESVQQALDATYGAGEKLLYGEPWGADNTHLSRPVTLCHKGSLKSIHGRIGAFCDDTRDAVKGSVMDPNGRGFVNGGGLDPQKLHHCLVGWAGDYGVFRTADQTITYLSCHDDWTLWDKLVATMGPRKHYHGCGPKILRANRLAAAINFCCQGRPFFLAGEEFGRTKGGIKNSYCSSSEINQLDWTRAWKNRRLADYYRGLIALRMQLPGVQDKTENAAKRVLWVKELATDCVMACLDNRGEGSKWEQLILIFNCSGRSGNAKLPEGNWQILVDGGSAFRWQKDSAVDTLVPVAEYSAMILGRK